MSLNSDKVAEILEAFTRDDAAKWVSHMWSLYNRQRAEKLAEWEELDRYIFATDTTTTSNKTLPWKNSTTNPKICQIRDNLHANYISALFPNDNWLQWQGYSRKDITHKKKKTITAYMENKARMGGFRQTVSNLLYDYISRGNAFAAATFENRHKESDNGIAPIFVGPKAIRIAPEDIVFNPLADFENSPKIIRSVKTLGELKKMAAIRPDQKFWIEALEKRDEFRNRAAGGQLNPDDFNKVMEFNVDGFGNLYEYLMGEYVEVLEFYGDFHNSETGELKTSQMITVVDRSITVREADIPTYDGKAPISHAGWRKRSNNSWAMGPLDNLVGLQYRLDHLENAIADATDLAIQPPLKIKGEVEEFDWFPGAEIHIDEQGDVEDFISNIQPLLAGEQKMDQIEFRMELYAGAPREAMGIRTPGEKTAFEVQELNNAAGRIFQEKVTNFEIELMEPLLNNMLALAHQNFEARDTIRTLDDDLGVEQFQEITKEDITATGVLRPVGARHFAKQSQDLQNLIGVMSSPLRDSISPHTSNTALTKFVEDVLDIRGYEIFKPNVGVLEQQETQRVVQQAEEDLELEATADIEQDL